MMAQANDAGSVKPTQAPDASSTKPVQENDHAVAKRVQPTRRHATLDDRVKAFGAALNLTEAQQAAVKMIREQREMEILRLRSDSSISGSDRIAGLRALHDQTAERIRAVLNDEQKKNYDPLAARKVPPAPDQKSIEDWLKLTTPH